MSIYHLFNEYVVLSFFDVYKGLKIRKYLSFLLKSQKWSKSELVAFQNEKLNHLLNHAYKNVPFYTELFDKLGIKPQDIRSMKDLQLLPVLTKKDIRENIRNGKLIAKNLNINKLISNSSSGSTGEPLQFYQCHDSESMKKACAIRGWYWMNYRLGDKIVRIGQIPRRGKLKLLQDYFTRSYYIYAPALNNETFHHICADILKHKPKVLRLNPDTLSFLVDLMSTHNISFDFIEAINTTGSTLTDDVRIKTKRVLNCEIFDSFSCEGGAVVFESQDHNGYYSAMEYAITEVLNTNNTPSNKGRLVTTDLWNYATPFIRYDTQDIVELFENSTDTELHLLRIKKIYGRESDILVLPDNQLLIVNNFTGLLQSVVGLEQFQIKQISNDTFYVFLKCDGTVKTDVTVEVNRQLLKIFPSNVNVTVKVVNDIPVENSGKRRFLVRDENIQLP